MTDRERQVSRAWEHLQAKGDDPPAARTVAASTDDDSLHPPLHNLQIITRDIAGAVSREAGDVGVGRDLTDEQIEQELDHEIWNYDYPTLKPI